jgi:hypothetical protein
MKKSLLFILTTLVLVCITPALAGTIVDEWGSVQPPAPVELKNGDRQCDGHGLSGARHRELTCNMQARPRCVESAPRIGAFLAKAREAGMPVVHSLTSRGTVESILPPSQTAAWASPLSSPAWTSSSTRISKTILKKLGVSTVIITGTTAEGAVLHTATGASMRG